jgi:hypothetical protein
LGESVVIVVLVELLDLVEAVLVGFFSVFEVGDCVVVLLEGSLLGLKVGFLRESRSQ